jgi:hypothetical protein
MTTFEQDIVGLGLLMLKDVIIFATSSTMPEIVDSKFVSIQLNVTFQVDIYKENICG